MGPTAFFVLCERESLVIRRKQGGRNISIYKWHRKSLFVVYSLIATSTVVQKISCPRVENSELVLLVELKNGAIRKGQIDH